MEQPTLFSVPERLKVCNACQRTLPITKFRERRGKFRRGTFEAKCRKCFRKTPACLERFRRRQTKTNAWISSYLKAHPCVDCGERDIVVLEFDHRDPSQKKLHIGNARGGRVGLSTLIAEIAKCDVRCCNCHRRRTAHQLGSWRLDHPSERANSNSALAQPRTPCTS